MSFCRGMSGYEADAMPNAYDTSDANRTRILTVVQWAAKSPGYDGIVQDRDLRFLKESLRSKFERRRLGVRRE